MVNVTKIVQNSARTCWTQANSYQLTGDNHSLRDPEDRVESKADFIEQQ